MNATDERAALLAAVIAEPEDDGARLAYADLLDENGEGERSEFIRVQIALEMAKTAQFSCNCTCEYEHGVGCPAGVLKALRRRERELWEQNWWSFGCSVLPGGSVGGWNQTIPYGVFIRWRGVDLTSCHFARGFVDSVTLRLADWLAHGPALVLAAPLTSVRLSDRQPRCGHIADPPHWTSDSNDAVSLSSGCLLPAEVWRLLTNREEAGFTRTYATADLAWANASRALLAWARRCPACGGNKLARLGYPGHNVSCPTCAGLGRRR